MLTSTETKKNNNTGIIIFSILLVIVAGVFFALDFEKIKNFIAGIGVWGILVSILVYALLGLTLIPSEPLTILTGAIFGPLVATLVAGVGNTLSALVEYYLGKKIGQASNFMEQKHKLPFGLGKLPVDSPLFLIAARSIPGYGPKAVSFISGVYHVPLFTYLWTAAIPTFLGAAIFAFGGFGLGSLFK
jgi:uncharacterized membrane protein YdjX (TVP38/TMEM64 family)